MSTRQTRFARMAISSPRFLMKIWQLAGLNHGSGSPFVVGSSDMQKRGLKVWTESHATRRQQQEPRPREQKAQGATGTQRPIMFLMFGLGSVFGRTNAIRTPSHCREHCRDRSRRPARMNNAPGSSGTLLLERNAAGNRRRLRLRIGLLAGVELLLQLVQIRIQNVVQLGRHDTVGPVQQHGDVVP